MKAFKLTVAILLAVAAIAYAAKVPTVFCEGLEGFAKPAVTPEVTVIDDVYYVDFGEQLGPKGSLQFTVVDGENIVLSVGAVKAISQKGGKVFGTLDTIISTDTDLQLKLKGITVGTVIAAGVKNAQVAAVTGGVAAGNFAKGAAIKVVGIFGGELSGIVKSVACASFDDTDATEVTTPKKLALKAKANLGGVVTLPAGIVYTAKNVTVVNE